MEGLLNLEVVVEGKRGTGNKTGALKSLRMLSGLLPLFGVGEKGFNSRKE